MEHLSFTEAYKNLIKARDISKKEIAELKEILKTKSVEEIVEILKNQSK